MKTKWIVLFISVIIIGFFITSAVKQLTTPHELTVNEMTEQIEQIYNAKVQTLVEKNDAYVASFNKDGSIFEVNVDPVTGQYSELKLVHKKVQQETNKIDEKNNTPSESPEEQPKTSKPATKPLLSEQQAINIALKEVHGEVDSVEFENSADGGSYFIEIEQEDEVTVQVHAITGKILSIEYED